MAALSDDIAYNNHDLHDGLRAGLLAEEDVEALPIARDAYREVDRKYPGLDPVRRRHEALRQVFGAMVSDVIETSRALLADSGATSVEDIRHLGRPVIRFSDLMWADLQVIRAYLFKNMYRAPSVMAKREEVTKVVEDLFPALMAQPTLLPSGWQDAVTKAEGDATALARLTSDYISGMTDRFALQEHARLFGQH